VHRSAWPKTDALDAHGGDPLVLEVAAEVLGQVRKAKTAAKKSLRVDVALVVVRGTREQLTALDAAQSDVMQAGRIAELQTEPADELAVLVTLAD
jgi:valyl-tRNA synthetase